MIHPWQVEGPGASESSPWSYIHSSVPSSIYTGRPNGVSLVAASQLQPEAPNWIRRHHLAVGKLTLLAGAAGTGKTTLGMDMAAIISVGSVGGRDWPDGSEAPQGDVVIWSGEDGVEDTLLPRLIAANAHLERVHFVRDTIVGGRVRAFDPATDLPHLATKLAQYPNTKLLIIDPIIQVVSGNANSNQKVREAMQPLLELAERAGCAILGISHLTKSTKNKPLIDRITGSLAFPAVARTVLITSKVTAPDGEGSAYDNVLVLAKTNIGPKGGGNGYSIESCNIAAPNAPSGFIESSRVVWGDVLHGSAEEILQIAESSDGSRDANAVERASNFLVEVLSRGPQTCQDVHAWADEIGISAAAIKRAKMAGRPAIKAEKIRGAGSSSGFIWSLMNPTPHGSAGQGAPVGRILSGNKSSNCYVGINNFGMVPQPLHAPAFMPLRPMPAQPSADGLPSQSEPQDRASSWMSSGFPNLSPDLIGRASQINHPQQTAALASTATSVPPPTAILTPTATAPEAAAFIASKAWRAAVQAHELAEPLEPLEPLEPVEPVVPLEPVDAAPRARHREVQVKGRRSASTSRREPAGTTQTPPPVPQLNDALVDWASRRCVAALDQLQSRPDLDFDQFNDDLNSIANQVVEDAELCIENEDEDEAIRVQLAKELHKKAWWTACPRLKGWTWKGSKS